LDQSWPVLLHDRVARVVEVFTRRRHGGFIKRMVRLC
jgi:hypothetical protein